MKREEYDKKLIADRGQKYFDENKGLLDSQWEYIESLGDIDDIKDPGNYDLIISTSEFTKHIKNGNLIKVTTHKKE